jgi:very-short-patch-repair endonuclease
MKNFSKSILNYFATYNETRFRFSKKIPYAWTNDELTLDFSVFPELERKLLFAIVEEKPLSVKIQKGEYQVSIDQDLLKERLLKKIEENYNFEYLQSCIEQSKNQYKNKKAFIVDENGNSEQYELDLDNITEIINEGFRIYNLAFREEIGRILINLQSEKESELQDKYYFEHKPNSSFNPFAIEQTIFDDLQKLANATVEEDEYLLKVISYIQGHEFPMVMFDLHLMLLNFLQYTMSRTSFIFFDEITDETVSYPLFFIEINIKNLGDEIIIENARDILMLNTPAINSFRFENVLTTPRACLLSNAKLNLNTIDQFIQAYYKNTQAICLQPCFIKIVAKELPTIKYRVGLQLLEEDRKILDYSELITKLGTGAGNKFVNLVSNYVEGNVENTTDEIHREYKKNYPKKSVNNIIDDIPLKLNDSQKRILLAAKNHKNKTIKVEGPPGTGKSYTICALVYLANSLNKSVLITSHKTQALDVVEEMLNDQFQSLHPKAKPPMLRMTTRSSLGSTSNNFRSTLASSSINAASERALNFNKEAVESDIQRLQKEIEEEYHKYWENSEEYYEYIQKSFLLIQRMAGLFKEENSDGKENLGKYNYLIQKTLLRDQKNNGQIQENQFINRIPLDIDFHPIVTSRENFSKFQIRAKISWEQFLDLYLRKAELGSYIEKCDQLNKLQNQNIIKDNGLNIRRNNLRSLEQLVDFLLQYCVSEIPLEQINFNEVRIHELSKVDHNFDLSTKEANNALDLLERLSKINKSIFSRILKKTEKQKVTNELNQNYPQVYDLTQQKDPNEIHSTLKQALELSKGFHEKYPFLKQDYLIRDYNTLSINELIEHFEHLSSLKYDRILTLIARLSGKSIPGLTFGMIKEYCEKLRNSLEYKSISAEIDEIRSVFNFKEDDLSKLFQALQDVENLTTHFDQEFVQLTKTFIDYYEKALTTLGIETSNVNDLSKLSHQDEDMTEFWEFVELHQEISHHQMASPPDQKKIAQFEEKVHKLLENQNDKRFKDFNNFSGDVQRAITAFNSGKRLSKDQAQMLLNNLSCIIAPPNLISEFFPMDKDIVDILIIDEASQVSIAESISLMLRAKQTIVFGDELQYGAVSAQNVSKKYSTRFFKDILDDYEKDKNEVISEQEKERLASEVSEDVPEEELTSSPVYTVNPNQKEWLKTFGIRTSTLSFANALANYKTSLDVHFRSFPEIISYSREKFYKKNQINLKVNRIRTKPISQVLRFIKVEPQGFAGKNINLDEIDAIKEDLEKMLSQGFQGTIGIICSFREQANRMEAILRESLPDYYRLIRDQALEIWFVGDVQGVERDIIYYSFVEDKEQGNGSLKYIYPVVGGRADNIHNLQKQRLNVGFSRAKDTMVFVHSMPLEKYADTSLGEALNHYQHIAQTTIDNYVEDEGVFGSPAEKRLYQMITRSKFYLSNINDLRLIPQFNIGKYLNDQYQKYIPNYRVDFLLTLSKNGKERSLIIEYDGIEYHFKNPDAVTKNNFDQEYIEYDIQRQLELEQYGYSFLRINKFNLMPEDKSQTEVDVLNKLLTQSLID